MSATRRDRIDRSSKMDIYIYGCIAHRFKDDDVRGYGEELKPVEESRKGMCVYTTSVGTHAVR